MKVFIPEQINYTIIWEKEKKKRSLLSLAVKLLAATGKEEASKLSTKGSGPLNFYRLKKKQNEVLEVIYSLGFMKENETALQRFK